MTIMKTCTECKVKKNFIDFHKNSDSQDGHNWKCKKCVALIQRKRKAKYKEARDKLPEDWSVGKTKTCTECKVEKNLSEFNKHSGFKDGYCIKCKKCDALYQKELKAKYKEARDKLPEDWSVGKTKTCTECKVEKNLTEFHKHSGFKDGYCIKCKKCIALYQKELKAKYKERRAKLPKDWAVGKTKTCSRCSVNKELSEFHNDVLAKDGHKAYCRWCHKKYKDENKDKIAAYNEATKEHRKKKAAKYFQDNKEEIYAYRKTEEVSSKRKKYLKDNAEKLAAQHKEWNITNKGLVRSHRAKRRAAILQATVPWVDLEAIKEIYVKAARLSSENGIEYQVDHLVPLQGEKVCGLHCETNLQILTRIENQSKHNKFELI